MSDKSQKIMKNIALVVLSIVFVVFLVLFFAGRVGDFLMSDDTSSGIESSIGSQQSVTASVPESMPQSTASTLGSTQSKPQSTAPVSSSTESKSESTVSVPSEPEILPTEYRFRNSNLLNQHYEKHGRDMGFASAQEYELAAAAVPNNPEVLHKTEKEDGDDVYYVESTNEFVVISTDGYIRTYFNPDRGIDYYNKQ